MKLQHFFDARTWTLTWVVHDEASRQAIVIDPVADFDPKSGRLWFESCEAVARHLEANRLELAHVLETHAHADHLSGAPWLVERFGVPVGIGAHITEVQAIFRDVFNLGADFPVDGSQFDRLFADGDILEIGALRVEALHTPGHTPACLTYRIGDALFVGDTLFAPDYGTARCDFPGGSAETLYDSVQRLYAFPDATPVMLCHDYRPGGRALVAETTIGAQKRENVQLDARTQKADYVAFRRRRDAELDMPVLILPSVQVNIRAGQLPPPESNDTVYLKLPINRLKGKPAEPAKASKGGPQG
jgi:glyoxylase-like metal-dependent hydrolase (beta-lactamase superfamily II)